MSSSVAILWQCTVLFITKYFRNTSVCKQWGNSKSGTQIFHIILIVNRRVDLLSGNATPGSHSMQLPMLVLTKAKHAGFKKCAWREMGSKRLRAEDERLKSAVRSESLTTLRRNTCSKPWSGFSWTFLQKPQKLLSMNFNEFLTMRQGHHIRGHLTVRKNQKWFDGPEKPANLW